LRQIYFQIIIIGFGRRVGGAPLYEGDSMRATVHPFVPWTNLADKQKTAKAVFYNEFQIII
jgi:hypothetical protein